MLARRHIYLYLVVLLLLSGVAFAATPGGLNISNTAHATYEAENGFQYQVTSNTVWVKVAQSFDVEITPNGTSAAPGQSTAALASSSVSLYYVLKNPGNGSDSYTLTASNVSGDDFDLSAITIYIDRDGNGTVDSGDVEYDNADPPVLGADEVVNLIVTGTTPVSGVDAVIYVNLSGQSNGDTDRQDIENISEVALVSGALITATKSADDTEVLPGQVVVFTISAVNSGNDDAGGIDIANADFDGDGETSTEQGLLISDELPEHTTYVEGSASGTHANGYPVFAGVDGIWKTDSAEVSVVVSIGFFVPPDGAGATLLIGRDLEFQFSVAVDANAPAGQLTNSAEVGYSNASGDQTATTNTVYLDLGATSSVVTDDTDDDGASTGSGVSTDEDDYMESNSAIGGHWETFLNEAWNFGNATDIIEISHYKAGSSLTNWDYEARTWKGSVESLADTVLVYFYNTDGSPLADSDGDGAVDIGPLASGERFEFLTRVYFPLGSRFSDVVIAIEGTSSNDESNSDYTFDKINEVMPVLLKIRIETSISSSIGATSETLTDAKLMLYEYDSEGNFVASQAVYANSDGSVVLNDPENFDTPLYKVLKDGDPEAGTGAAYRLSLVEDYEDYTYYLTPLLYKADFDQVALPGESYTREKITIEVDDDGTVILTTPLDPAGYVYDAITGEKIDGACITFYKCTDGADCNSYEPVNPPSYPEGVFDVYPDGLTEQENPQVSGRTDAYGSDVGKGPGAFEFLFEAYFTTYNGWYFIELDFDCGLSAVDTSLTETYGSIRLNRDSTWSPAANPLEPYTGEKFYIDETFDTFPGATKMNIPLLPADFMPLKVEKEISESVVTIGDIVKFTITVTNVNTTATIYDITVSDDLPREVRYKEGSLRVDSALVETEISSDAQHMTWLVGDLAAEQSVTTTYYVYIIPGATEGNKTNKAYADGWADTSHSIEVDSNDAYAFFRIKKGIFTDKGYVVGKVFIDDNDNRVQDNMEQGVGDVRIYMEDGRYVVTDGEGKYHMDDIEPGTHVLKIDETTLPPNARLAEVSNRNMSDPATIFVDLFPGDIFKANFRLLAATPEARVETESDFIEGTIIALRAIETVLTDPSSGKLTLRHILTVTNDSALPVYELRYTEVSPFVPLRGTVYLSGSPMADPEAAETGFSWLVPVVEPGEELVITFNSEVPKTETTANAVISFRVEPAGKESSEDVVVPIVFTRPGPLEYNVTVYFDLGAYDLSEQARTSLDEIILSLRKRHYNRVLITIRGHTDSVRVKDKKDGFDSNLELSRKRSETVKSYMLSHLMDMRKVTITGAEEGSTAGGEPASPSTTAAGPRSRYSVSVYESDDRGEIKAEAETLSVKGLRVYIKEEVINYSRKTYKLYAGLFDTEDEATRFSVETFGREYPVEALSVDEFEVVDTGKTKYYFHMASNGSGEPSVDNVAGPDGTAGNRRADVSIRPLAKTVETALEIKLEDMVTSGKYRIVLSADHLYPLDEIYDVGVYLVVPPSLAYINSSARINDIPVDVKRHGRFHIAAAPRLRGQEPFTVETAYVATRGVEGGLVSYTVIGSTAKGKTLVLLSSASDDETTEALEHYSQRYDSNGDDNESTRVKTLMEKVRYGITYPGDNVIQSSLKTEIKITLPPGLPHELTVNGVVVEDDKIGETSVDGKIGVKKVHYIGVELDEGDNEIVLFVMDQQTDTRTVIVTGDVYDIRHSIWPERAEADGRSPVYLVLKLVDHDGMLVRQNAYLEAYVDKGDVFDDSDGSYKSFVNDAFKVRVTSGKARLRLSPAVSTEHRTVTVRYGNIEKDFIVKFYPELRPWIVVGDLELAIGSSSTHNDPATLVDTPFDHSSGDDVSIDGGIFAKGSVDDYTVTLRYKREPGDNHTLLDQDSPSADDDERYPTYGDETEQVFEAQSQHSIYLKVENDLSSVLFGDYYTEFGSGLEFNRYDRTLSGGLVHYEASDLYSVRTFVSENSQSVVRDEIVGSGLSGPYFFSSKDIVENSDTVWLETRDRYHETIILETTALSRNSDYTINYEEGWIVFKAPVSGFDEDFNPVLIQAVYETTDPGEDNLMYGVRGERRLLSGKLRLGASVAVEEHSVRDKEFYGADLTYEHNAVTVVAEVATTENFDRTSLAATSGMAYRIEASYQESDRGVKAYFKESDDEFQNPTATTTGTSYETYGITANMAINEGKTTVTANVTSDKGVVDNDKLEVRIGHSLGENLRATAGVRVSGEDTGTDDLSYGQAIAGIQYRPLEKLALNLTREQTVFGDTGSTLYPTRTIGGLNYTLSQWVNAYLQTEYQETDERDISLSSFGLNSTLTENTTAFSKYSLDNAESGWRNQAHMGLNHTFIIRDGYSIDAGGERVQTVSGGDGDSQDYTALRLSGTYLKEERYKLTGRYEIRLGDDGTDTLLTAAMSMKLDRDYTLLISESYMDSTESSNDFVLGLAYRPIHNDRVNSLAKLRWKNDSADEDEEKYIGSIHLNYQPATRWTLSGEYAVKVLDIENVGSSYTDLWRGRVLWDINDRFDFNVHSAILTQHDTNVNTLAWGAEGGMRAIKNIWLSLGYNFSGFDDDDFSDADYWSKGVYFKVRLKFDEHTIRSVKNKLASK